MSDTIRCPDCGHPNPPGSTSCEACNFPLAPVEPIAPPEPVAPPEREPAPEPTLIPPRRPFARRHRPAQQALSLWLLFGGISAAAVLFVAVKANVDRASQPVEGSNEAQQKRADELRAALAKDSTDVEARIGLANVLYDTGNWSDAIVHYRAAVRRDSSRATVLVDLGVCYYNLGQATDAERLFELALRRDPHQPVALFNLGIVHERRNDDEGALQYFHRALQSDPPEGMRDALMEAMQRLQQRTGRKPPPLPDGAPDSLHPHG